MKTGKHFTNLMVWHKAANVASPVYAILKKFPSYEKFALCDQIRRATISISSNIAEGQSRGSDRAFINHLYIAKGSASEVESQLYVAVILGYISQEEIKETVSELEGISQMLMKLILSIERRSNNNDKF